MKTLDLSTLLHINSCSLIKRSHNLSQFSISFKSPNSLITKTLFLPSSHISLDYPLISFSPSSKKDLKWWGTFTSLLFSWEKELFGSYSQEFLLKGTGFKLDFVNDFLILDVGLSHELSFKVPEGITVSVSSSKNSFTATSKKKHLLTQFLASLLFPLPKKIKKNLIAISKVSYNKE